MVRSARQVVLALSFLALLALVLHQLNNHSVQHCPINSGAAPLKELRMASGPVDRNMPLIFIGGVPRSGTTLARAMLDAHPLVRCGEETRVIPRILSLRSHWKKSAKETMRLNEAGLTEEVLNSAISSFMLEVIVGHGEPAARLCNKDPFTIKSAGYLHQLFPRAKFIFMVRDGRATVHSIISRQVTITGFDLTNARQCLRRWNTVVDTMDQQCEDLGERWCLRVPYELLVLEPRRWMQRILSFLDVPWNETVLHHERTINKPGGVSLSKVEKSSDQVVRPVNTEALTKWVGWYPEDVVSDMAQLAPMLETLGYDPDANPPNYRRLQTGRDEELDEDQDGDEEDAEREDGS